MRQKFIFQLAVACLAPVIGARAVCTYVSPKGEWNKSSSKGLQQIIDRCGNSQGSAYVCINSDADQLEAGAAATWSAEGSYSVSVVAEMGRFSRKGAFGIYNAADPGEKLQLLSGKVSGNRQMPFDSPFSVFGFYIKTKKGYWYSDSALNNPMKGPRDQDHMVAYAGKDGELKLGDGAALEWDSDCLLLGWEDLNLRRSDRDYNDWVLMFDRTNSFHPVPDHTGTLFWLGGLLAVLMVAERLFPFQTSPLRR